VRIHAAQVRALYGVPASGADGKGDTVAIVDAFGSPNLYSDASTYAQNNDPGNPLPASQFSQQVAPPTPGMEDPTQCDAAGWYGEQTLDVEAVHAVAPAAHILYVGGADCQDATLTASLNSIVAAHSADIVTNSYGDQGEDLPASDVAAAHQVSVQAGVEGIGLYFSSGDSGDENANVGRPEPDFQASDPNVTAVGGTSTGIGEDGSAVVQTGWETAKASLASGQWTAPSYVYGSGGGTSRLFPEPAYQQGVVPPALAQENQTGTNTGRVVPDLSALADPNTGFLIGITQTFPDGVYYGEYRIGGTSLASPIVAALGADADQLDGYHHGFVNPLLYQSGTSLGAISDVVPESGGVVRVDYANGTDSSNGYVTTVRTFNYGGLTIHTATGYDNVTGVGTPSGFTYLRLGLAPTTVTVTPSTGGTVGSPISASATVAGDSPTGSLTFELFGPADSACSGTPLKSVTATLTNGGASSGDIATSAAGTYHWTVSYPGDSFNRPSTVSCVAATTVSLVPTTLTISPPVNLRASFFAGRITFTAKLTVTGSGAAVVGRKVSFTMDLGSMTVACSATTGARGQASCSYRSPKLRSALIKAIITGAHPTERASFAGDATYRASSATATATS
jgi:subtilase family serine protease